MTHCKFDPHPISRHVITLPINLADMATGVYVAPSDPLTRWEARSALRYGSRHEGFFPTWQDAVRKALHDIKQSGSVGRITCVIGHTVYYDEYDPDDA